MNYRRSRPRTTSTRGGNSKYRYRRLPYYNWLGSWPRWHDIIFHTRPRRRQTKACEIKAIKGYDLDAILWPLEKKPHIYYW